MCTGTPNPGSGGAPPGMPIGVPFNIGPGGTYNTNPPSAPIQQALPNWVFGQLGNPQSFGNIQSIPLKSIGPNTARTR